MGEGRKFVLYIYITVLKGKGLVFFSSFDMTLKRF